MSALSNLTQAVADLTAVVNQLLAQQGDSAAVQQAADSIETRVADLKTLIVSTTSTTTSTGTSTTTAAAAPGPPQGLA